MPCFHATAALIRWNGSDDGSRALIWSSHGPPDTDFSDENGMTRDNDYSGKELADEVTPRALMFSRRQWLKTSAAVASVATTFGIYRAFNPIRPTAEAGTALTGVQAPVESEVELAAQGYTVDDPLTPRDDILTYNNFYEFTTNKRAVASVARGFDTSDWVVAVDGLAASPREFSIADLKELAPLEERIYRMRCVETWSMVIPWNGIPLSALLAAVRPLPSARYVAFETLLDPSRMPGQRSYVLDWPYVEGLRLDEAMHPLTILALGLYGEELPPQDGAPVRLVVPWKYGFKGIKSIVRITLTDTEPPASWNLQAPHEYGFYANVNPSVPHPRWSQATEQRIGEIGRRETLLFNGYESHVASLYEGMDLEVNF